MIEGRDHVDVNAPEGKSKATRTRKRAGAKAPTEAASKRSLNLRVDEDTYERLHVHALRRRGTVSDLVMELARLYLREFTIHRTGGVKGEGRTDGQGTDGR